MKNIVLLVSCFLFLASSFVNADEAKPTTGYNDGFFVQSADGNFKLKFNANMQFRYEYQRIESARDNNFFSTPRSRLIFTGNAYTPKLTYMIMPELGDYDQTHSGFSTRQTFGIWLRDLWFNYALRDEFQVKVGQFFLPRHRQATTVSTAMQFGEWPITALGDFTFAWDRGIDLHGAISKFDYDAYIVNGSGGSITNASKGMNVGTRVVYNIFGNYGYTESDINDSQEPNLAVGSHLSFNNNDNYNKTAGADPSPDYLLASGDVALKYKGFSLEAEFMNLHNFEGGLNHPAFTVQSGYFLIPKKFEVAAEASRIFMDGADNDQSEYVAGASYYFKGHKVKVHATYSLLINEVGTGVFAGANDQVNHRLRALAGFAF